jgi:hypothetical protein
MVEPMEIMTIGRWTVQADVRRTREAHAALATTGAPAWKPVDGTTGKTSDFEPLSPDLSIGLGMDVALVRPSFQGLPLVQLDILADLPWVLDRAAFRRKRVHELYVLKDVAEQVLLAAGYALSAEETPDDFGSHWFVYTRGSHKVRFVWDGRDGCGFLEHRDEGSDPWNPVGPPVMEATHDAMREAAERDWPAALDLIVR